MDRYHDKVGRFTFASGGHDHADMILEVARMAREAQAHVHAKMAAKQMGEAFAGLPGHSRRAVVQVRPRKS